MAEALQPRARSPLPFQGGCLVDLWSETAWKDYRNGAIYAVRDS